MSQMVEKVARAICASDFGGDTSIYDTMSDAMRENFTINARAAIEAMQTVEAPARSAPQPSARYMGFTGNTCTNCQSTRMQVAGHCEVCCDCGTTTGCS